MYLIMYSLPGMFHGLSPLASSESELTSETMNPFGYCGRNTSMGDQPIARTISTFKNSRTQKYADILTCLERDSTPRSQCSSSSRS